MSEKAEAEGIDPVSFASTEVLKQEIEDLGEKMDQVIGHLEAIEAELGSWSRLEDKGEV